MELAAPLTEEEQVLGDVKRKEAEEGRGMAGRRSHVSSGVSMPVTDEALATLKKLGEEEETGNNLVQLVRLASFVNFISPIPLPSQPRIRYV